MLFADRAGWIDRHRFQAALPAANAESISERDTWMNIFQNNRKIGFSHAALSRDEAGLLLRQTLFMRINTMGMVHGIHLKTEGRLRSDMTLAAFRFSMHSGRFAFAASGSVHDKHMVIQTESAGERRTVKVSLASRPYLAAGLFDALWAAGPVPGFRRVIPVFDPATMGQEPVTVEVLDTDTLSVMGESVKAWKVAVDFKGVHQRAWIGEGGEVLRQEGFIGITMEKTDRPTALHGLPVQASTDMTEAVSLPSNVVFERPQDLQRLTVQISDVDFSRLGLDGGRQRLDGNRLHIEKETLSAPATPASERKIPQALLSYLAPTPLIQSDHPRIAALAKEVTGRAKTPLDVVERLTAWMQANIEPRPVISMPDALATLEHRRGDCNEHAVLMAALARAAGIPAQIEAGLVYLKGRFFYHAWNRVYIGRWITVDALFGQVPADVTHIRLTEGAPERQLDLISVIGRVRLQVLSVDGAAAASTDPKPEPET